MKKKANFILQNMNQNADPCEDLFEFTCGNFVSSNRIPDDQTNLDSFGNLRLKLAANVADQLETKVDSSDTVSTANAKKYYKSCMDEGKINKNKIKEIIIFNVNKRFFIWIKAKIESSGESYFISMLYSEMSGFPIMSDSWSPSKTVTERLVQLRMLNHRPLLSISVTSNPKNPAKYTLAIDQPTWFFSKKYYEDTKVMDAYKTYVTKTIEYLGPSNANYKREIDNLIDLEIELSKVLLSEEEKRNLTYNTYTIEELDKQLPEVNLV